MSFESPTIERKKKFKLHPEMFKTDGFPEQGLILERGVHVNDVALRAFVQAEKEDTLDRIFSRNQRAYIEAVHLPQCQECRKRLESIRLEEAEPQEIEF